MTPQWRLRSPCVTLFYSRETLFYSLCAVDMKVTSSRRLFNCFVQLFNEKKFLKWFFVLFGLKLDLKVMSEHNTTENKTTCTKQSTPILLPTSDTCETAEKSHNMLLKYIMQHILSTITTHQPQDRIKTLQDVNNNNNTEHISTAATTCLKIQPRVQNN